MEIKLYGDWTKREPAEFTEIGKQLIGWLSGEHDNMTPELAAIVREEFAAQEDYRVNFERNINAALDRIGDLQTTPLDGLELPTGPAETYAKGRADGMFQGMMVATQIIREAMLSTLEQGKRQ